MDIETLEKRVSELEFELDDAETAVSMLAATQAEMAEEIIRLRKRLDEREVSDG